VAAVALEIRFGGFPLPGGDRLLLNKSQTNPEEGTTRAIRPVELFPHRMPVAECVLRVPGSVTLL